SYGLVEAFDLGRQYRRVETEGARQSRHRLEPLDGSRFHRLTEGTITHRSLVDQVVKDFDGNTVWLLTDQSRELGIPLVFASEPATLSVHENASKSWER